MLVPISVTRSFCSLAARRGLSPSTLASQVCRQAVALQIDSLLLLRRRGLPLLGSASTLVAPVDGAIWETGNTFINVEVCEVFVTMATEFGLIPGILAEILCEGVARRNFADGFTFRARDRQSRPAPAPPAPSSPLASRARPRPELE